VKPSIAFNFCFLIWVVYFCISAIAGFFFARVIHFHNTIGFKYIIIGPLCLTGSYHYIKWTHWRGYRSYVWLTGTFWLVLWMSFDFVWLCFQYINQVSFSRLILFWTNKLISNRHFELEMFSFFLSPFLIKYSRKSKRAQHLHERIKKSFLRWIY